MSEQTCGNCRFKGKNIECSGTEESDWEPFATAYFLCDRIKQVKPYDEPRPNPAEQKAYVEDGSGYYAALCVSDDFACNRWEPKDPS